MGGFVIEFPLVYRWVRLKPFGHLVVEFLIREWDFLGKACEDFSAEYICADSMMEPFMGTAGTITLLVAYDEKEIIYLATTNVR